MTLSEYYSWFRRDWAKAGFLVSIFLTIFLFVFVKASDFIIFLILLQTPLYMLHETEEYIFPGGFGQFFNKDIFRIDKENEPIDERFIFFVNVILIWISLPLFGLLSVRNYNFGLWIPYFSFFAGVAHIALAIKSRKKYNPGMVVSLLLNIPVGAWVVYYFYRHSIIDSLLFNVHCAIGLGVNLVLPVAGTILFKTYMRKQIS